MLHLGNWLPSFFRLQLSRWGLRFLYPRRPDIYLHLAKKLYRSTNPNLLADIESNFSEDWWWVILWRHANQYVQAGGTAKYPQAAGFEDALYRDILLRRSCPGPIKEALDAMRAQVEKTAASLMSEGDNDFGTLVVDPVLKRDLRLRQQLDREDLLQYAVQLQSEVAADPTIDWPVGSTWEPEQIQIGEHSLRTEFLRRVLQDMAAQEFHSNKAIERNQVEISDPDSISTDEQEFDSVEWRMVVDEFLDDWPPMQREALQIRLQAYEEGRSLEEMADELGKDPQEVRNNFKAAKIRARRRR